MADKKAETKKSPQKPKKTSKTKANASFDGAAGGQAGQGGFHLQGQYITDLSFECPQPPALLGAFKNNMSLDVGVQSQHLHEEKGGAEAHEVTLVLRSHNKTDDGKTIYLFEMKYSGLFVLENISNAHKGGLLGVEAPALLYPFARQIFMATIAGSGFQPPLLEPINFAAIYMQQQQQEQPAQAAVNN